MSEQPAEKDTLWGDLCEQTGEGCYICGDPRDHDGLPHGTVTGDGRVRADVTRPPGGTRCPHTDQLVNLCLCMIHDPDGAHFRATRPGMH